MSQEISYASYLLRVWREGNAPGTWRGEVESIQTGQKWEFSDLDSLFVFLRSWILGAPAKQAGQKSAYPS